MIEVVSTDDYSSPYILNEMATTIKDLLAHRLH
jgi:hypothetical protein